MAQPDLGGNLNVFNALTTTNQELIRSTSALHLNISEQTFDYGYKADILIEEAFHSQESSPFLYSRELYGSLYFRDVDLHLGKRMVSWGRAETDFVTSVYNPLYLRHGFSESFENISTGVNHLSAAWFFGDHTLQLLLSATVHVSQLPNASSSWVQPLLNSFPIRANLLPESRQSLNELNETGQAAFRYGYRSISWDLDLFFNYWQNPQQRFEKVYVPDGQNTRLELSRYYKRSLMGGFSTEARVIDGWLFRGEAMYTHSAPYDYLPPVLETFNADSVTIGQLLQIDQTLRNNEDGFIRSRPNLVTMLGVVWQSGSARWNIEWISDYLYNYRGDFTREKWAHKVGLTYTDTFFEDRLTTRFFSQSNLTSINFWVNPSATWTGIRNVEVELGAHLLAGKKPTLSETEISFAVLRSKSLVYVQTQWYW